MNGIEYCGCCAGITKETPTLLGNRPGLSQIGYRVGTWAQFKASMLAQLATTPELAALRTRDDDDFTIALCDAFAIVCDILTFYYERSANEHYLNTATQLVSVAELAALIGYQPAPGVAASAALAFTLDAPPPALPQAAQPPQPALVPNQIAIPVGTQIQSVPGPGEQPVTFETVAPIAARYAWNALSPRLSRPYAGKPAYGTSYSHLRLKGLVGTLQTGDYALIVLRPAQGVLARHVLARVTSVVQDTSSQTTLVSFENGSDPELLPRPSRMGTVLHGSLSQETVAFSVSRVTWLDQTDFVAQAVKLQWDIEAAQAIINSFSAQESGTPWLALYKLGVRASIFGHNAPNAETLPSTYTSDPNFPGDWEGTTLLDMNPSSTEAQIFLDASYPSLTAGAYVVLLDPNAPHRFIAEVTDATTISLARFLVAGNSTLLTLDASTSDWDSFYMRSTAVLGSSDRYEVAEELLDNRTIGGSVIELDSAQLTLRIGQEVIVSGISSTKTGQQRYELRSIHGLSLVDGRTVITLDEALDDTYVWNSVAINANVAPATHGASCSQILGSGDATQPYQRFALNQLPVTYVSAATPSTTASTLSVRVNGESWTEVPWLYGHGPTERVYTTRLDVLGNRFVEFGDGVENGARLPTGSNNVIANYRQGLGSAGNVAPLQLSTLLSRPLGLRSVVNPLASTGGGDPQTLTDTQATAPITVRALDRIVSLDDFTDFARASAAVSKASAVWAWDGHRRVVCITVSGPNGAAILPGTPQFTNLLAAIIDASDGTVPVALRSFVPRTFTVGATLTIDPTLDADAVTSAAKSALQAAYAFDARDFMQPVYRSEVIETLQNVPGVIALTLDTLRFNDRIIFDWRLYAGGDGLIAAPPEVVGDSLVGAELITIDTGPLPKVVHA